MAFYSKETFCQEVFHLAYDELMKGLESIKYSSFEIPKKNGKRLIEYVEKNTILYSYQQSLIINYLCCQDLPRCVKGYVKDESYYNYLKVHTHNSYFMRLDIKDFFGSINDMHIEETFGQLINISKQDEKKDIIDLIKRIVLYNGKLPQGASTSPIVSNIVFATTDQRILKYCQQLGIRYSRYADDLLFSSLEFDFKESTWFIKTIKKILSDKQLTLNYSKNKFAENEISLNGFVISTSIRLSRKRLSDIRMIISELKKYLHCIPNKNEEALDAVNLIPFKFRGSSFNSIYELVRYLCGYRAFLIAWLDDDYSISSNQKEIRRIIENLNGIIDKMRDNK